MHYIRYEAHYITFSTLLALSPSTNIFLCRDRFFPNVPLISINLLRSTVKSNGGTDVYIEFNYSLQNVFIRNKVCHKIRYLYSAVLQNWKCVEFLHLLACLYTTQHIYHYKSGTHIPVVCLTLQSPVFCTCTSGFNSKNSAFYPHVLYVQYDFTIKKSLLSYAAFTDWSFCRKQIVLSVRYKVNLYI